MVARRDVHDRRAGGLEQVGPKPLVIQRDFRRLQLMGLIHLEDFPVPRRFHRVDPVEAEELNQQGVEVFGAGADDDLLRRDDQAAKIPKVVGDGRAQSHGAAGRGVGHQRYLIVTEYLSGQLRPKRKREGGRIRLVALKIGKPVPLAQRRVQ